MASGVPGSFESGEYDALLAQFMSAHNVDSDEVRDAHFCSLLPSACHGNLQTVQ